MSRTPTSIKIVSILGIIYAAFAILATSCGTILIFFPLMPNDPTASLNNDALFVTYNILSAVVWVALGFFLLIASIFSLKLKPSGRKLMLAFAWAHILVGVIGTITSIVYLTPKMCEVYASDPRYAGAVTMARISGYAGAAFGLLISIAISAVILYFFNRKIAIDAFNGILPPAPSSFPVEFPHAPSSPEQLP